MQSHTLRSKSNTHVPFPLVHLEKNQLPRLPIPSLQDTIERYLSVVQCISSPREYEHTKQLCQEFLQSQGTQLHQELLKLNQQSKFGFLEGFWNTMYLAESRQYPIVIHTNPYFRLRDDPKRRSACLRAANLLRASCELSRAITHNQLPPEYFWESRKVPKSTNPSTQTPLCMTMYHWIFSSRIARPTRDQLKPTYGSRHAIVLCRYQYYRVELYERDDIPRSEESIYQELTQIYLDATKTPKHRILPVGVLTSESRDEWAKVRQNLESSHAQNRASLAAIDDALILIVLDETSPEADDWSDISRIAMHSDGRNVWFDKSLQVIVCQNGVTGLNMEHAGFDGHQLNSFADFVYTYGQNTPLIEESFEESHAQLNKLQWHLTKPIIKSIKVAERNIDSLIEKTDISVLLFHEFGKETIKKLHVSPDAFVQMAFQLTYYRLFCQHVSTYEPAMVQRFYHGRTMTIRVCTKEACQFTEMFMNPLTSAKEKADALRIACKKHVEMTTKAREGQGIDRHLYAMEWLARQRVQKIPQYQVPELFKDIVYSRMRTDLMSTSNSSGIYGLRLQGFGPVCEKGFGLGYIYDESSINVTISNFEQKSKLFKDCLRQSLVDMKRVLEFDQGMKSKL